MPRTFVWHPGKGPKATPANKVKDGEMVRIKQVRSGIGHEARMRATLAAMDGLAHLTTVEQIARERGIEVSALPYKSRGARGAGRARIKEAV